jgi:SAM-dependent methyltransferase
MNLLSWARSSIQQRGLLRTSRIIASNAKDYFFDWRHGTQTFGRLAVQELEGNLPSKEHAVFYQATKAQVFERLLQALDLPSGCGFVDIGSGKGRVLLLAAQHDFIRVVGVEFSRQLCEQARSNIEVFFRNNAPRCPIEVLETDATTFDIPADLNVFYLYNPFDADILKRFLANVARSLETAPRRAWLIYNNPLHDDVVLQSGLFQQRRSYIIGGGDFAVHSR